MSKNKSLLFADMPFFNMAGDVVDMPQIRANEHKPLDQYLHVKTDQGMRKALPKAWISHWEECDDGKFLLIHLNGQANGQRLEFDDEGNEKPANRKRIRVEFPYESMQATMAEWAAQNRVQF